jgi:hypothetical protein
MNVHHPRDRSHYERFAHFHQTFYRSVEATSVTPFSPERWTVAWRGRSWPWPARGGCP